MACGIVAYWGEVGETVIKICDFNMLSGSEVFDTEKTKIVRFKKTS